MAQLAVAWNHSPDHGGRVGVMQTRYPWPFGKAALETGANPLLHYANGKLYVISRGLGATATVTEITKRWWRPRRTRPIPDAAELPPVPALVHDAPRGALFVPEGVFDREGLNVFDAVTGDRLTPMSIRTTGPPTDLLLLRTATAQSSPR
jgi:hypothetical protein